MKQEQQEQNVKPEYVYQEITNKSFIRKAFELLNNMCLTDDEKLRIFELYELELNKGVIYPRNNLKRMIEGLRTFKHYFASRHIFFSTLNETKRFKEAKNEEEKAKVTSGVQTDFKLFERACRSYGINSEISRGEMYFEFKYSQLCDGILQCDDKATIDDWCMSKAPYYLKYEPKRS